MKKIVFIFALLTLSKYSFAQTNNTQSYTDSINTLYRIQGRLDTLKKFYTAKNIVFDSILNIGLYSTAYDWIGTPYRYSRSSKKGIDCSGFTKNVYKEVYCKELQGGSADLYTISTLIEKKNLKEGDLIFFKIKKGRISHVGVYLRNNKFVHASVKGGVMINDLDEAYYKKYFFKGGRL